MDEKKSLKQHLSNRGFVSLNESFIITTNYHMPRGGTKSKNPIKNKKKTEGTSRMGRQQHRRFVLNSNHQIQTINFVDFLDKSQAKNYDDVFWTRKC